MRRPLEIVIEFPVSLGLALLAAQQHADEDLVTLLVAAERDGAAAGARRLQADGGYLVDRFQRTELELRMERHPVALEPTVVAPHLHLEVAPVDATGAQVHLPAVARAATAAQNAAVAAMSASLEQSGIEVAISRTPAGREIVAFAEVARTVPRVMTCGPLHEHARQIRPLDRYDDTARTA
ncbi:hypothetical protein ABT324_30805 [Saccharopolyspora sp. NPDC000359]|uniref:hypothetical protein n=1 Tax=Saccharopolyspora sp. NPDC000359 TaxID=3154251 RepID=UPI00331A1275